MNIGKKMVKLNTKTMATAGGIRENQPGGIIVDN